MLAAAPASPGGQRGRAVEPTRARGCVCVCAPPTARRRWPRPAVAAGRPPAGGRPRSCDPTRGPMTSTSVGASIPGANPAEAAALARTAADDEGISPIPAGNRAPVPGRPRPRSRVPRRHGRDHQQRHRLRGGEPPEPPRRARRLRQASRAGTSSRRARRAGAGTGRSGDTTIDTSTVAASPGPNARSRPPRATSSAPVPAATISPAASTMRGRLGGRVAHRLEPVRALGQPRRMPERKNTQ